MEAYDIVRRQSLRELLEYVNKMINDGYIPQGGIFVTNIEGFTEYYQAMFKPQ